MTAYWFKTIRNQNSLGSLSRQLQTAHSNYCDTIDGRTIPCQKPVEGTSPRPIPVSKRESDPPSRHRTSSRPHRRPRHLQTVHSNYCDIIDGRTIPCQKPVEGTSPCPIPVSKRESDTPSRHRTSSRPHRRPRHLQTVHSNYCDIIDGRAIPCQKPEKGTTPCPIPVS